jgi:hypothetical protein
MLCCRLLRPIRSLATINKAGTPAPHAGQISLRPIRTFTIVGRHFEKEEWTCFEFQWLSFSEPWWLRVPSAYRLPLPTPGAAPTKNACPPAPKPAADLAAPIAARRSGTSAFRKSANRIRSGDRRDQYFATTTPVLKVLNPASAACANPNARGTANQRM